MNEASWSSYVAAGATGPQEPDEPEPPSVWEQPCSDGVERVLFYVRDNVHAPVLDYRCHQAHTDIEDGLDHAGDLMNLPSKMEPGLYIWEGAVKWRTFTTGDGAEGEPEPDFQGTIRPATLDDINKWFKVTS